MGCKEAKPISADAMEANVGVKDLGTEGQLTYAVPVKSSVTFEISEHEDGKQRARFEAKKNGQLVRFHNSIPFPAGQIKRVSEKVTGDVAVVKVKKDRNLDLGDYFQ